MTGARTDPYRNPGARDWRAERVAGVAGFHRSLPGYAPTRLVPVPGLAQELGVRSVFVKEESSRLGLPAFKVLGASYAVSRALSQRYGADGGRVLPLDELRAAAAGHDPVELIAATDGNHGRAVAHFAGLLGLPSRIFFPAGISAAASAAISAEASQAVELGLPYDGVVNAAQEAAASAGDAAVLIQDTSWPGYEQIPQWITDGYSTLFHEVDEQLAAAGAGPPGLVAVPVGVGALAHAAVLHYRSGSAVPGSAAAIAPTVLSVEPAVAPAIISSLHAGRMVTVPTAPTIMNGLNCGTPSASAWPVLRAGLDAAVTVTDGEAARAVRDLEAAGVDSGPCGAASLAGVRALARTGSLAADTTVLLLSTEGRAANPLPEGTA
ncbi:MAG TPA: pyridoxal-phosphate dependent enzyme [Streptosporangiaceae bacterium]